MWKTRPEQRTSDEIEEMTQPVELLTLARLRDFLLPFAA
jgi:hypothetical protein